jgi:plasmid stabilization system protein ParE
VKLSAVVTVAVLSAALNTGCSSAPTPQQRFDERVRQFGQPDFVDAPMAGGQRQMMRPQYARREIADSPEQIFYYVDRDEQVAFLPGQPPARGPINPMARRALDQLPAEEQRLKQELPEIMRQTREELRRQGKLKD